MTVRQSAQRASGAAEAGEKEQRWEDGGQLAEQTLISDDGQTAAERGPRVPSGQSEQWDERTEEVTVSYFSRGGFFILHT